jgi:hypothetical protein
MLITCDVDEPLGHGGEDFDAGEFRFTALTSAHGIGDSCARRAFAAQFDELAQLQRGLGRTRAAIFPAAQHVFHAEREFRVGPQSGLQPAGFSGLQFIAVREQGRISCQSKLRRFTQAQRSRRCVGAVLACDSSRDAGAETSARERERRSESFGGRHRQGEKQ